MIAVIGGAGLSVQVRMRPQEEPERMPPMGDSFDYSTLNIAAKIASGDEIMVRNSGCGFNISMELAAMGHDVAFASVVGNDAMGLAVTEQLKRAGIHIDCLETTEGETPVKVELLNILGDPQMAFGNDKLYAKLTPSLAEGWRPVLEQASAIVLDGNLPKETLAYIAGQYGGREDAKLFFDPAGHVGAANARDVLDRFYCIMPGRVEAEAMARKMVLSEEQLAEAGAYFADRGIARTIITIKGGGLYYKEGAEEGILRPDRVLSFAGTFGAGDVTSAAVIAASLEGKTIRQTAEEAMKRAAEFLSGRSDERMVDLLNQRSEEA